MNLKKLFIGAFAAALLAGCAAGSHTPATLPAIDEKPVAVDGTTRVTSVKELTASIVPGAVVEIPEGTFRLEPENADMQTYNSYCRWKVVDGGYELEISDVSNVTIRGAGMDKTTLEVTPRAATVLTFRNCKDVTLEGFSAGHTMAAQACEGNVVALDSCQSVTVRDLGLYGCGAIGIHAWDCQKLRVLSSEIYECSVAGMMLYNVNNCTVQDSVFRDLESDGVIAMSGDGLEIVGCTFRNNYVNSLLQIGQRTRLTNCTIQDNQAGGAMFEVDSSYDDVGTTDLIIENCTGSGNQAWSWYTLGSDCNVLDETGQALTEEDLAEAMGSVGDPVATSSQAQETVVVTTADEFLAAIGPNKEIVIDTALLDLSTASHYGGTAASSYYYWSDPFDGPQLNITGVDNLTIRGKGGADVNVISAVPRYAHVLNFEVCTNITVKELTAGHTVEPGYCAGGVLMFTGCSNVNIENTGLYGCGTIGINAQMCRNMVIQDNDIYECSQGGISLYQVKNAQMNRNTFRDLGDEYGPGFIYSFSDSDSLTIDGTSAAGNLYVNYVENGN